MDFKGEANAIYDSTGSLCSTAHERLKEVGESGESKGKLEAR